MGGDYPRRFGMLRVVATAPSEVWSWDITKLAGPQRGTYYHLYVVTGIFSRCAVHFEVHATELGQLAKDFITEAILLNGGIAPHAIHDDRGTSMTSKPVSALLSDLAILKSHSRPKVSSNDNPYSEAQFKTLKYCPAFPGRFGSLQDARAFCRAFFTCYNHEHRHSGIGLHTPYSPYSVHIGTASAIQDKRQAVLNAARAASPHRFSRHPRAPDLPGTAWINKQVTDSDMTRHPPREAT
jgi:putative transposase